MRAFVFSIAFALLATGASAAPNFQCDVSNKVCSCTPPKTSEDCKGMTRNCDGEITCGGLMPLCRCKWKPVAATPLSPSNPVVRPVINVAPVGEIKRQ